MLSWVSKKITDFLNQSREVQETPFCDFSRLRFEIRSCDVILVEGRTRIGDIIKTITLSRWTHAALFVGRLSEIEDEETRKLIESYYPGDQSEQLIIESLLGEGTVVSPLTKYQYDNLRICRPKEISPQDVQKVINTAARYLGGRYDMRFSTSQGFLCPTGFYQLEPIAYSKDLSHAENILFMLKGEAFS